MFPLLSFLKCKLIKYISNKRLFRFFYCMRINSSLADINMKFLEKKPVNLYSLVQSIKKKLLNLSAVIVLFIPENLVFKFIKIHLLL